MGQTLGIIGAGNIRSTVARLAVAAGIDVVIGNSRGRQTLTDLVAELGDRARAADVDDLAREADIVVAAVPFGAYTSLPADALAGKVVIDTTNYYPDRDRRNPTLDDQSATSSELVQAHLATSKVVKAFNSIGYPSLHNGARPAGSAERNALPIAGDDAAAKAEAATLIDALGYDTVDLGPLAESWRSEPGTPVYVNPYMPPLPTGDLSVDQMYAFLLAASVVTTTIEQVADLTASAQRGPAGG